MRPWQVAVALGLIGLLHLATPLVLTFDSGDYLSYLPILDGRSSWRDWDPFRGPVFPGLIYVSDQLLGASARGFLVTSGVFLLALMAVLLRLSVFLLGSDRRLVALNPITFGWYHVMLTEFVATTVFALSCWLAFEWVRAAPAPGSWARWLGIPAAFAVLVPLAYHLKQPYGGTALYPLLAALVWCLVREPSWCRRGMRTLLALGPCVALAGSLAAWTRWLPTSGAAGNVSHTSGAFMAASIINGLPHWHLDGPLDDWAPGRVAADPTFPAAARMSITGNVGTR